MFGKEALVSDVYVARQPIFDKEMNVYCYELLYRQNRENFFEEINEDKVTASVVDNFFLMSTIKLLAGSLGLINF